MEINNLKIKETVNSLELKEEIIQRYLEEADSAQEKIFHKFKEATEGEYFKRRWLWELLQNASDTVSQGEKVNVKISIKSNVNSLNSIVGYDIVFEHDGGVFNPPKEWNKRHEFKNFILAKSGKFSDDDKVGKFGTGFLSTHCLSDKITIEGKCKEADGNFVFRKIELDRSEFRSEDTLSQQIRTLKIIKSLDQYELSKSNALDFQFSARFTYNCDIHALEKYSTGIKELFFTLPYVFAFNPKIGTVQVTDDDGYLTKYTNLGFEDKLEFKLHSTKIESNKSSIIYKEYVACLEEIETGMLAWKTKLINKDGREYLEFIDERKDYLDSFNVPMHSLFCQFPLIGSDSLKFPVIINSKNFRPEEKRHGINLIEENQTNKKIIESAIKMYENYLVTASKQGLKLFNIVDTLHELKLPSWIDENWYKNKIREIRAFISKTKIIDKNYNLEERLSFVDSNYRISTEFPIIRKDSPELNKRFYDFMNDVDNSKLPVKDHVEYWLNTLWEDEKVVSRFNFKEFLKRFANDINFEKLLNSTQKNVVEKDKIKWLNELYKFIIYELKDTSLLNFSGDSENRGIVLTRGLEFRKISTLKKEEGFDGAQIDDKLIKIYNTFFKESVLLENTIIHNELKYLITDNNQVTREEEIAKKIKDKVEELIKKHDECLKIINNNTSNKDSSIKEKNEIEQMLSMLQDWISENNSKRNYFDQYIKRKILQAIIDEKKSIHLTKILEFDRSGKITIERQVNIMSDEDLDEKLRLGGIVIEKIREKENRDEQNRNIGNHFESLFKSLMEEFNIPCIKVDGKQDFILHHGTSHEKYIELKSINSSREFVKLSPEQAVNCVEKKDNFFLCIIPYSGEFVKIDKNEFKNISRFSNQLTASVQKKLDYISEFCNQNLNEAIKGKLVDKSIVEHFREKQYTIEIERNKISTISFYEALNKFD
jgi:hypothetical protein